MPALKHIQLRPLFTKLAFVNVGVESEVIVIPKESGDFASRESQFEEFLDPLQICIKFTFLKGAFWFAQYNALLLFGGEGLFRSQTNEIALQLRKKRKEGNHNFGMHIMLGDIQLLLENDHADVASNQFIDKGDDFNRTPAQAGKLGDHQNIRIGEHAQDFLDTPLFAGLA